jgi:hypothetical protein
MTHNDELSLFESEGFAPVRASPEGALMKKFVTFLFAATLASVAIVPAARPAQADTTSTVAIAAAAAAIVGAILVDSNHQTYYVNNGRHVYVSQQTATYYRAHGNYYHGNHGQAYNNNQHYNNQQHYNNNQQTYNQQHHNNQYGH